MRKQQQQQRREEEACRPHDGPPADSYVAELHCCFEMFKAANPEVANRIDMAVEADNKDLLAHRAVQVGGGAPMSCGCRPPPNARRTPPAQPRRTPATH
jgi:hypothetical protein